MFRCLCACLFLMSIASLSLAEDTGSSTPTLIRYTATLLEGTSNGGSRSVREFEIRSLVSPQSSGSPTVLYLMDESSDEQPWYEQFGQFGFDAEGRPTPRLALQRHMHDGHSSWVGLQLGHFPGYTKLTAGMEWSEGTQKYLVKDDKSINNQLCSQLEINAPQGRRTTLAIQKSDGAILAADHRYFVGMGERYDLNLRLEEIAVVDKANATAWTRGIAPLLKLKQKIAFDPSVEEGLSVKQIELTQAVLDDIDAAADGTPFAALAGVIRREVTASQQRDAAVAELSARFEGRPAPSISLTPLDGGETVDLKTPGRVTVLHFWEYQEKPLAEPYGQIGYLDFLAQKRRDQIQVFGVISDKQLQSPATASAALRSARKLREFMNIGYPLARETQGALTALGDPRSFGVELPLWVVIGADGTILHYRVGFYEVDSSRGLEELDAVLDKALSPKK